MKINSITLKQGYRLKFLGEHILIAAPNEQPYLIALKSIENGQEVPRETDQPIKWDI